MDITQFTGLPIIYLTTNNDAAIEREDYVEGRVSVDGWRDYPSLDEMDMKIRAVATPHGVIRKKPTK